MEVFWILCCHRMTWLWPLMFSSRNYMNDSFRTNVFMKYQPETIACACIYLAARQLQVPLPNSPPWFALFGVEEEEIHDICYSLLRLYARKKPNCDKLEKIVDKAKKIQVEAKLKAKGLSSEHGTPNSASRQNSPKNVSPNPGVLPGMRKVKIEDDSRSEASAKNQQNHTSRKRGHSDSDHSGSSRRTKSRSRSSSRSRSYSRSPPRRKYKSPPRKYKKDKRSPERYLVKEKHSHKKKRHSRSRSRSRSRSVERYSKSSLKKYYKEKDRLYSPERHRSRKHRNGHHRSPSRDRYEKYRR